MSSESSPSNLLQAIIAGILGGLVSALVVVVTIFIFRNGDPTKVVVVKGKPKPGHPGPRERIER